AKTTSPFGLSGTPKSPSRPSAPTLTGATSRERSSISAILQHARCEDVLRPQSPYFLGQGVAYLQRLAFGDMAAENGKDRARGVDRADRLGPGEPVRNALQKLRQ